MQDPRISPRFLTRMTKCISHVKYINVAEMILESQNADEEIKQYYRKKCEQYKKEILSFRTKIDEFSSFDTVK